MLGVFDILAQSGKKNLVILSQHRHPVHWIKCALCVNRLQYFARGLQVYIRQLRVALQGKTGDALKTEEVTTSVYFIWLLSLRRSKLKYKLSSVSCLVSSVVKYLKDFFFSFNFSFVCTQNKIKVVALKITNNINVLIKVSCWSLEPVTRKINACKM